MIYYVKNGGNDAASGQSDALAWETIAKVNGESFNAGDSILFNRDDTFIGTLTPPDSGAAGNYITFGAYGTGEKPIITPNVDEGETWTLHSGEAGIDAIYKTTDIGYNPNSCLLSDTSKIYKINDYWYTHTSGTWGGNALGILALPTDQTFEKYGNEYDFWDGNTALYCYDGSSTVYFRFRDGENPNDSTFKISVQDGYAVSIVSKSYITITDLHIIGGDYGVRITGYSSALYNVIKNCTIEGSNRHIFLQGAAHYTTINDNIIKSHHFAEYQAGAWDEGSGAEYGVKYFHYIFKKTMIHTSESGSADGAIMMTGGAQNGSIIYNNIITNCVNGIAVNGSYSTIFDNDISGTSSTGMVLGYFADGTQIYDNYIHDSNIPIRFGSIDYAGVADRTFYVYRNRIYNPNAGTIFYLHYQSDEGAPSHTICYLYHNSFISKIGFDCSSYIVLDAAPSGFIIVNNIISVSGYNTEGQVGIYTKDNIWEFYYNWIGGTFWGGVGTPTWASDASNVVDLGGTFWNHATDPPDFTNILGTDVMDAGIDLSVPFILGGVPYPAMPGMVAGYYYIAPDIGWYEYFPPTPTPTTGLRIGAIKINISRCAVGIYLRWWFNGWHYFNFTNGYEIIMRTESMGTQVTRFFSVISKVERPTRLKAEYLYKITVEGIAPQNIGGFTGLIMAEKVEQYEDSVWREVEVSRGSHTIRNAGEQGFEINFEVYRKELPESSAVFLKSLELYLGDTLCDMDDSEIVPINKQTNDIAEMQDRQSDFTAQFKIRKTRAMRALFELSGEVGASTDFPFIEHECKLIQDHIEIITGGLLILKKGSDQYYNATILSGNKNFFKTIELLKLNDLILAGADHTWDVATMVGTHAADLDYVYPLLEPSDDGGITPISDDGDRVDMYGGWIWPFINVKTIWDEIFSDAGYICEGDILTNEIFTKLHIPISSRSVTKAYADRWLYSMWWGGAFTPDNGDVLGLDEFLGTVLVNGTYTFHRGFYITQFDADYKIKVNAICGFTALDPPAVLTVYLDGAPQGDMIITTTGLTYNYEYEISAVAGQTIAIVTNEAYYYFWSLRIVEIVNPLIGYSSAVVAHNHIPAMSQTDFIKTICNMFGLIPDVTPRDRKIRFWNYLELYENIFKARDWSAYLSERDDETEFKYGEYARDNYLRYRESEDVINDTGTGSMQIDDTTLPAERDVVELSLSTADEVIILDNIFPVNVSRIAMNKYDIDDSEYIGEKTIDPRIVYVDHIRDVASPAYEKTMGLRATVAPGATTDVDSPKKSTSIDVSFASLVISNPGYSGLSRLLTKTNLRRAKFNLPVYEVAGLKHYIPIYLSQYKAYFYVNKINNYVPGKLCTIDLIKL